MPNRAREDREREKRDEDENDSSMGVGLLLVGALVAGAVFLGGYTVGRSLSWLTSSSNEKSGMGEEEAKRATYVITPAIKARMVQAEATSSAHESMRGDVPDGSTCVYCLCGEREMMFNSCGHVCVCEACVFAAAGGRAARENVSLVLQCPLCREKGTLRRVYT